MSLCRKTTNSSVCAAACGDIRGSRFVALIHLYCSLIGLLIWENTPFQTWALWFWWLHYWINSCTNHGSAATGTGSRYGRLVSVSFVLRNFGPSSLQEYPIPVFRSVVWFWYPSHHNCRRFLLSPRLRLLEGFQTVVTRFIRLYNRKVNLVEEQCQCCTVSSWIKIHRAVVL